MIERAIEHLSHGWQSFCNNCRILQHFLHEPIRDETNCNLLQ